MKPDEYLRCAVPTCHQPYETGPGPDGALIVVPTCTHAEPELLTDDGWALVVLP